MDSGRQQAFLMAQLNKKRELKEKYLYRSGDTAQQKTSGGLQHTALGELVMSNIMLLAIRGRKDVFGAIGRLRSQSQPLSFDCTLFDTVLDWCGELADTLDCGVYEFFIDDKTKRRKIAYGLLENLRQDPCSCWEDISIDNSGNASFVLPHFDHYYRMSDQPDSGVSLVFRKEAASDGTSHYWLLLGDVSRKKPDSMIQDHAVLWDEDSGCLQEFTDAAVSDLEGGWALFEGDFTRRRELLRSEAAKLLDLCDVLAERPGELNFKALLRKKQELLEQLCAEERAAYGRMPSVLKAGPRGENVRNCLILLGGAAKSLERAVLSLSAPTEGSTVDILAEAAYLMEHAGDAI